MAAKALQPKVQEHASVPPAFPKDMPTPPPSKEQPASSSNESKSQAAVPRPKQTVADLQNSISDASGLPASDVKKLLNALRDVIAKNLPWCVCGQKQLPLVWHAPVRCLVKKLSSSHDLLV